MFTTRLPTASTYMQPLTDFLFLFVYLFLIPKEIKLTSIRLLKVGGPCLAQLSACH